MREFAYRAANGAGNVQNGKLEAGSRDAALRQLRGLGLTPIRLDELAAAREDVSAVVRAAVPADSAMGGRRTLFSLGARVPDHNDVHDFTSELAVMLRAGSRSTALCGC